MTGGIGMGFLSMAILFVHSFMMGGAGVLIGALTFRVIQVAMRLTDRAFKSRELILGLKRVPLIVVIVIFVLGGFLLLLYVLAGYIGRSIYLTGH